MDFFGVGPLEIFLILLLAFLFFGPEKLPEIATKIGRIYRNLTRATSEINRTINEEISLEKEKTQNTKNGNISDIPEKKPSSTETPVEANKPELMTTLTSDEKRND
jgi:Sec-independent protein translocase protein TatA